MAFSKFCVALALVTNLEKSEVYMAGVFDHKGEFSRGGMVKGFSRSSILVVL